MKYLFAVFAVFFLVPILLLAQARENIVVLPPIAASRTRTPPPQEMRKILIDFHKYYQDELRELTASDQPPDLWWILVVLVPECKDYKGWCIQIRAVKEKRNAEAIIITQIPISDKAAFDSAAEAKKAAKKTKEKIAGHAMKGGNKR